MALKCFRFNVFVPGFCYFRKPTNTAYLDTYCIPPPTTIRGLLSNAIGLSRGDLRLQDKILLGIRKNTGEMMVEYAQLLKEPKSYFPDYMYAKGEYMDYLRLELAGDSDRKMSDKEVTEKANSNIKNNGIKARSKIIEYSTSPMKRGVILDADYTIYIASEDELLLKKLKDKLLCPERPLYLGASDSIADVYDISHMVEIEKVNFNEAHSVCLGVHQDGFLLKLPYKFIDINKKINLVYSSVLTIFNKYPARLSCDTELYKFENEYISLL